MAQLSPLLFLMLLLQPTDCTAFYSRRRLCPAIPLTRCYCFDETIDETVGVTHLNISCIGLGLGPEVPAFYPVSDVQVDVLYLFHNKIHRVQNFAFQNFSRFSKIHLSGNKIVTIDEHAWAGVQNSLKVLNMDLCELKAIPPLTNLSNQTWDLNLRFNNISCLQNNSFSATNHLRRLNLANNTIKTIEVSAFAGLQNSLESLILRNNPLRTIPSNAIRTLSSLQYLDLRNIHLNALNGTQVLCKVLRKLTTLILSHNKIEIIPEDIFKNCLYLEVLDLSYNKIKELSSKSFSGLGNKLVKLDLRGNDIFSIPDCITRHTLSSKILRVDGDILCDCKLQNLVLGEHLASLLNVKTMEKVSTRNLKCIPMPASVNENKQRCIWTAPCRQQLSDNSTTEHLTEMKSLNIKDKIDSLATVLVPTLLTPFVVISVILLCWRYPLILKRCLNLCKGDTPTDCTKNALSATVNKSESEHSNVHLLNSCEPQENPEFGKNDIMYKYRKCSGRFRKLPNPPVEPRITKRDTIGCCKVPHCNSCTSGLSECESLEPSISTSTREQIHSMLHEQEDKGLALNVNDVLEQDGQPTDSQLDNVWQSNQVKRDHLYEEIKNLDYLPIVAADHPPEHLRLGDVLSKKRKVEVQISNDTGVGSVTSIADLDCVFEN